MSERLKPGKTKMKLKNPGDKRYGGMVGTLTAVHQGVCMLKFKNGDYGAFDRGSLDVMRGVVR